MSELRIGVLGTARIAEQLVIPAIGRSGNARVVAVSSGSGRAAEYAERLGIPAAYESHDELLASEEVDAVYVPLPNSLHAEWSVKAAAAGKHVLCEKPIAMTPAELAEIEAAGREHGVQIAEAFMYRHHPQIAAVRELLASGRIGRLVAIDARFHYFLDRRPNIRLDPALGGGALRDVGCYPIDLANLLVGRAPTEVRAVATMREGVDMTTAGTLCYDDVVASFSSSFESPAGDQALLMGTEGSIELRGPFRPDRFGAGAVVVVTGADGSAETTEIEGDLYRCLIEDFADAVLAGRPDEAGQDVTRWTTEVIDRVRGSI
jgi:D-xylose 1-dehydrogenase (NADP+, D-xylono-1,5-lactone-forming)